MQRLVHHTGESAEAGTPRVRAVPAHVHAYVFAAVLALALPSFAHGATRHVADTGTDGPNCGIDLATACRSITKVIQLADPGDTILVGPGRYGDLNRNGVLGDIAGEEIGSPGCSCVLSMNKNVIILSSGGAAVTMIDGRFVDVIQNVFLTTVGGEFGRPGKGFTVTDTGRRDSSFNFIGHGIGIDAADVKVRGNRVIFSRIVPSFSRGTGIFTVNSGAIRIEGNQVLNWRIGIEVRGAGAAIVSKNQVIGNNWGGIVANGGNVVGNVATGNLIGIEIIGGTTASGNAASMNIHGFLVSVPSTGVVTKNNIFGNFCGLSNFGVVGVEATNNYWGVATGPGDPPADNVCNNNGGTNHDLTVRDQVLHGKGPEAVSTRTARMVRAMHRDARYCRNDVKQVALLTLLLLVACRAQAQSAVDVRVRDQRFTVHAHAVPLGALVERITISPTSKSSTQNDSMASCQPASTRSPSSTCLRRSLAKRAVEPIARIAAFRAIAFRGDPASAEVVKLVINDSQPVIRNAAAQFLQEMSRRMASQPK